MRVPDVVDISNLAKYVLDGDNEQEDFLDAIYLGDLQPDGPESLAELAGLPQGATLEVIGDTLANMREEQIEEFAFRFGSNHAYPTAVRVLRALNTPAQIEETEDLNTVIADAVIKIYNRLKERPAETS